MSVMIHWFLPIVLNQYSHLVEWTPMWELVWTSPLGAEERKRNTACQESILHKHYIHHSHIHTHFSHHNAKPLFSHLKDVSCGNWNIVQACLHHKQLANSLTTKCKHLYLTCIKHEMHVSVSLLLNSFWFWHLLCL